MGVEYWYGTGQFSGVDPSDGTVEGTAVDGTTGVGSTDKGTDVKPAY